MSVIGSATNNITGYNPPGGQFWNKLARAVYPDTISEVLALSAHLYEKHGVYRQGLRAAVSYFVTDLEIKGIDEGINATDRHDITKFLNEGSGLLDYAPMIGAELLAYGTIFLTAHVPFERMLTCPECGAFRNIKHVFPSENVNFTRDLGPGNNHEPGFEGTCFNSNCESKGKVTFEISDIPHNPGEQHPIIPILIPPQIMRIIPSPMTGAKTPVMETYNYVEMVEMVNNETPEVFYDTRWDYIRSICKKKPIVMDSSSMLCLTIDPSAPEAVKWKGWGAPAHLAAFPYAAQLMLLDTYNEVATAEFSMPRRVISPPQQGASLRSGGGQSSGSMGIDFRNTMDPVDFKNKIQTMMTNLRADPSAIGVSPFPLQYQILGAESSDMITHEQLEFYEDRLLRSMGIIPELYKGGVQAQVATPSMFGYKMFEKKWRFIVKVLNEALDWLVDRYEERRKWPRLRAKLSSTAMENDPRITEQILMRNQAGLVSHTTANKILGLDGEYEREMIQYEDELQRRKQEEKKQEDSREQFNRALMEKQVQQQQQMEDEQAVMGGGAGGHVPSAAGDGGSSGVRANTPDAGPMPQSSGQDLGEITGVQVLQGIPLPPGGTDSLQELPQMQQLAQAVADRLIQLPMSERNQILESLKGDLPNLNMFVNSELDKLESGAAQAGKQALRSGNMPVQVAAQQGGA